MGKHRVGGPAQRAYTLIELMTVVAIVGVLATLAVYGVRKYIFASKSSEAMFMINTIKAHQETYKDETYSYLNINASNTLTELYPMADPNGGKSAWWNPGGANYANWLALGADATGPVAFGYACVAGAAGATVPDPSTGGILNFPAPVEPWYVIRAVGDQNGDDVNSLLVGSSFTREIYVEKDGE